MNIHQSEDRYAWYAALQKVGPIHQLDSGRAFLVVGHESAAACLRDTRLSSNKRDEFFARIDLPSSLRARLEGFYEGWLMYMDAPIHRGYRSAIGRTLGAVPEQATQEAADRVAALVRDGDLDVLGCFARPFVELSMPALLGCSVPEYRSMLMDSVAILDFFIGRRRERKDAEATVLAYESLEAQALALRERPGFLGRLFEHLGDDPRAVPLAASVIADTWEPVVGLIATGIAKMAAHPDLYSDSRGFFLENARTETPFQICNRIVRAADLCVAGHLLPEGSRVSLVIGAANRDPDVFERPHRFDPERSNLDRALSFGAGPHACVGARVSEQICRAAWKAARDAGFTNDVTITESAWRPVFGMRILDTLQLHPSTPRGSATTTTTEPKARAQYVH